MTSRLVAVLVSCVVLSGCAAASETDSGGPVTEDVTAALTRAAETGDVVNLAQVVSGDWDRLTFICPYDDDAVVTERLGFRWDDFPGVDQTEGLSTFVFSRDKEVAAWTRLPRSLGDPCGVDSSTSLSLARADAAFRVEQTSGTGAGRPFNSLRQTKP
jgi:hypothetical protein